MAKRKTLIPNDFRDFLSILSFLGFLGIFLSFTFGISWISDNSNGLFLILGGSAFLVVGKVFSLPKWAKNGIQPNLMELTLLVSIIFGLSSMIIGFFLIFGANLPISIQGFVGFLAIPPAVFILFDYIAKNK